MLVIIDLDGVVYRGRTVISGAPRTIRALREKGHRVFFLTNNSSLTREGFRQRLAYHGVKCLRDDIMSSGYASALFLKKRRFKGDVFIVGGKGLSREFKNNGFRVVNTNTRKISGVVVGMDRDFRYRSLYIAQQAILKDALFIATNADPAYPVEKGVLPGAGAMVAAIKTSTGTVPIIVGKPNPFILKEILRISRASPGETLLVGDRLDSDIRIGKKCGVKTVLVLTGITKRPDLKNARKSETPDYVIKNISGILNLKIL